MRLTVTFAALSAFLAVPAMAQPLETGSLSEKMSVFDWMHGEWRGEATVYSPQGVQTLTHTERVGPMLKGDLLAVEGLAYEEDGSVGFNAFGIISYDPQADAYEIRAYTGGKAGTYPINVTETGYEWTIPIGPEMRVDYVAVVARSKAAGVPLSCGPPLRRVSKRILKRNKLGCGARIAAATSKARITKPVWPSPSLRLLKIT